MSMYSYSYSPLPHSWLLIRRKNSSMKTASLWITRDWTKSSTKNPFSATSFFNSFDFLLFKNWGVFDFNGLKDPTFDILVHFTLLKMLKMDTLSATLFNHESLTMCPFSAISFFTTIAFLLCLVYKLGSLCSLILNRLSLYISLYNLLTSYLGGEMLQLVVAAVQAGEAPQGPDCPG